MNLENVAEQVRKGQTVTFIAKGKSMHPKVKDGSEVTVAPVDGEKVGRGDVVLVRVAGSIYLHLVTAVQRGRVQISNNKGHVNGWTKPENIYGRLVR